MGPEGRARGGVLRRAVLRWGLVWAVSGGLPLGCASLQKKESLNLLQESVETYNEAFRWKNYERAAQYIPADLRAAFIAAYDEESDPLHIDDYQIVDVKVENESSAVVRVKVRYMMLPSVTVERGALVQHWKRIGSSWIMESEEGSLRELEVQAPKRPVVRAPGATPSAAESDRAPGSAPNSRAGSELGSQPASEATSEPESEAGRDPS